MSTAGMDQALSDFVGVRPRLFGIAYRIVGSAHEAEDVVQDAWLRWHRTDRAAVDDPQAFLVTTTRRLAINVVQSARRRHETYVASWLSEERAADDSDPQTQTEHHAAVDLAVRLLLERLSPAERATFLLREGFEYPYRQVAEALRISAPSARQLAKRARDRLSSGRRPPVTPAAHRRLQRALASAARTGDLPALEQLLVADLA